MLIQSHLLLARNLLRKTCHYTTNLNKSAFYWGNIRPDIHSPFNRGQHKYEISMDMIEEKWQQLENTGNKCLYSYRLGVILHYIADFFCHAHNDTYYDTNLRAHFDYEQALHKTLLALGEDFSFLGGDLEDIRAYIDEHRASYLQGGASPERDCAFISQCAWTMTQWALVPVLERKLAFA